MSYKNGEDYLESAKQHIGALQRAMVYEPERAFDHKVVAETDLELAEREGVDTREERRELQYLMKAYA